MLNSIRRDAAPHLHLVCRSWKVKGTFIFLNYAPLMSVVLTGSVARTPDMASVQVVSCVDWKLFLQFKLVANICSWGGGWDWHMVFLPVVDGILITFRYFSSNFFSSSPLIGHFKAYWKLISWSFRSKLKLIMWPGLTLCLCSGLNWKISILWRTSGESATNYDVQAQNQSQSKASSRQI